MPDGATRDNQQPRNPRLSSTVVLAPVENGYLAYDSATDRVYELNAVASLLAELCDGQRSVEEIRAEVAPLVPEGAAAGVESWVEEGLKTGLLTREGGASTSHRDLSARELSDLAKRFDAAEKQGSRSSASKRRRNSRRRMRRRGRTSAISRISRGAAIRREPLTSVTSRWERAPLERRRRAASRARGKGAGRPRRKFAGRADGETKRRRASEKRQPPGRCLRLGAGGSRPAEMRAPKPCGGCAKMFGRS